MDSLFYVKNFQVYTPDGTYHQLFGGPPVNFKSLDGVGIPPIRRITQRISLQNGVQDRGFRLEPRRLTLNLELTGLDQIQADAYRDKMAFIFAPTDQVVTLVITKMDASVRCIDCYVDGSYDFAMSQRIGANDTVSIPLYAPDPTFYDPTQQSSSINLSSGSGSASLNVQGVTWEDWPIIDVTGPVTSFEIDHTPAGDVLSFSQAVPSGETFRIDLRPGYKTVTRTSDDASRIDWLTPAIVGAMSTMRVLSERDCRNLNPGQVVNGFACTGTGTTGASAVDIYWYKRYLSL